MTEITVDVKFTSEASEFESVFQKPVKNALSEFQKFVSGINSQTLETVEGFSASIKQFVSNAGNFFSIEASAAPRQNSTFSNSNILASPNPNEVDEDLKNLLRFIVLPLGAAVGGTLGTAIGGPGLRSMIGGAAGVVIGEIIVQEIIKAVENSNKANAVQEQGFKGPIKIPDVTNPRIITDPKELEEFNRELEEMRRKSGEGSQSLLNLGNTQSTLAGTSQQLTEQVKQQNTELQNGVGILELTDEQLLNMPGSLAMLGDGLVAGTGVQRNYNEEVAQAKETLTNYGATTVAVAEKTGALDSEVVNQTDNIEGYKKALEKTDKAAQNFGNKGLDEVNEKVEQVNKALSDTDLSNLAKSLSAQEIARITGIPIEKIIQQAAKLGVEFKKGTDTAKKGLASLGVFAGNIATNIADSFSNFISTTIKGDFDGIEGLWDNLLDSLQDTFADFAAGLLTNPIRLVFESTLDGKEGGIFDLLGGLFGGGKKDKEKSTVEDKVPPEGANAAAEGAKAASTINETVNTGFLDKISGVLGTIGQVVGIVGAIAGLVLSIVNIVSGLTKKKPRLDVDLDKLRDEFGKSTGEAAKVLDFLDDEVANSIINISVKRKAGLGGIGESGIKKQIREALQTQIQDIQDKNEQKVHKNEIKMDYFEENEPEWRLAA